MWIYLSNGELIIIVKDILEIADVDLLQSVQDFFSKTMNIASLIISDNGHVTKPSNFSGVCRLIRSAKDGSKRCHECDIQWGKVAAEKREPVLYTCHAGLKDFVVPIIIENQHIASFYGGQVLTEELSAETVNKIAKKLGVDEKEFSERLREIPIVSNERLEATVTFLHHVTKALYEILVANLKLTELDMCYKLTRPLAIEEWFFSNCPKMPSPITEREFEVLRLLVTGKSNTEIAKELFISVHTVKAHVSSILEKFGVEDRVQVAVHAVRKGLI